MGILRDQLVQQLGQSVQHRSERSTKEGDDGSSAIVGFLAFGHDVSRWQCVAFAHGPGVGFAPEVGEVVFCEV